MLLVYNSGHSHTFTKTLQVYFGGDELEVISFDDPVNTIPSANLIREDYTSSTEKTIKIPAISVINQNVLSLTRH